VSQPSGIIPKPDRPTSFRRRSQTASKTAAGDSFEQVGREWFESYRPQLSEKYAPRILSRLERDVFPVIGHLPIAKVDAQTLLDMVRRVERRGKLNISNRLRIHVGKIFRYAVAEGRAARDPSRDIIDAQKKAPPVEHRARVAPADMPAFFAKLAEDDGSPLSHAALRWTIMTMVRTNETRFAQWSEIEGLGTPDALWRIPASRMKMKLEHVVPITPQMAELLVTIRKLSGGSKWLFPVPGGKSGVISENRMLLILYRVGLKGTATVHGFRRVASTVLNEAVRLDDRGETVRLFDRDAIELQLAHVDGGVRGVYNEATLRPARRRMLTWWCAWLQDQEDIGRVMTDVIG
jgi:integrase